MSLSIIRHGILDTIQDGGRYGYRHLGINPSGAMDQEAAMLANILVGNTPFGGVIEMHFPVSEFLFNAPAIFALTGADFVPRLHGKPCPMNTPVLVEAGSVLHFDHPVRGARCYMAIAGGLQIPLWLGSASTHLKAGAGGWQGRKLLKGDTIPFTRSIRKSMESRDIFFPLGEPVCMPATDDDDDIVILEGPEYAWLDETSRYDMVEKNFTMSVQSDRMGFRLNGPTLQKQDDQELVSSPVTFGTLQCLPDGSLILLMADHQTTGGYPRIGQVISAHLSRVAQKKPGDTFRFQITDIRTAETLFRQQQQYLAHLHQKYASRFNSFF